jgi:hypothetical protein
MQKSLKRLLHVPAVGPLLWRLLVAAALVLLRYYEAATPQLPLLWKVCYATVMTLSPRYFLLERLLLKNFGECCTNSWVLVGSVRVLFEILLLMLTR